jgi:hypothetical protein
MREYLANGAQLGWLIDPARRSVTIYRPGREPEALVAIDSIAGEDPVAGFVLDLSEVWNPLVDEKSSLCLRKGAWPPALTTSRSTSSAFPREIFDPAALVLYGQCHFLHSNPKLV